MGLPGRPNIALSKPFNFANRIGLPGLIETPLKKLDRSNFLTTEGTKSCFPAETAPEVIMISIFELMLFSICFLKSLSSLSLKIPPSI